MPLSDAEERQLREEYDRLAEFLVDGDKAKWPAVKEEIIKFCVEHEIQLYNIGSLKLFTASGLLTRLLQHFVRLSTLREEEHALWKSKVLEWKNEFDAGMKSSDLALQHAQAHLTVGDQYLKTQKVSPTTLLTYEDVRTLFNEPTFFTDDILLFEQISLTQLSQQQEERLKKLIQENEQDKPIFLPVNHEGHWFYLLKQKDIWFIHDSQPLLKDAKFSPRQESIVLHSTMFIQRLTQSDPLIAFETTGEQDNDHDCGTRVATTYRTMADKHYQKQTHQEILIELVQKQVIDKEKLPQNIEEIFGQKPIIVAKKEKESPVESQPQTRTVTPLQLDSAKPKELPKKFTKANFLRLLNQIKDKQQNRLCHYSDADMAVNLLKKAIEDAADKFYQAEFSPTSLDEFERECLSAINTADETLGIHRNILGELFAGIKNFFVVLWKTLFGSEEPEHRLKFFDGRTDSSKILQDLRENVQSKQAEYCAALTI